MYTAETHTRGERYSKWSYDEKTPRGRRACSLPYENGFPSTQTARAMVQPRGSALPRGCQEAAPLYDIGFKLKRRSPDPAATLLEHAAGPGQRGMF
jgi:hypothetical protein